MVGDAAAASRHSISETDTSGGSRGTMVDAVVAAVAVAAAVSTSGSMATPHAEGKCPTREARLGASRIEEYLVFIILDFETELNF